MSNPQTPPPAPAARPQSAIGGKNAAGLTHIVGPLPKIASRRAVLLLTLLALPMLCLTVPDFTVWPIAYVCLVPWLVGVCRAGRAPFLYFASYILGLCFYLISTRWLYPVTPPGYFALCLFFALQFPLAAWPIRHLHLKRGISVALAAPVAWVALEFLRCIGPLGFPMALLSHSHYRVLTMIQISDIVGAYGVSFVLVMVNGWIADLLIQAIVVHRAEKSARLPAGSIIALIVFAGTIIYGMAQSSTEHLRPGPKVAMVQLDVPMHVDDSHPGTDATQEEIQNDLHDLTMAAIKEKPALVILPETALHGFVNEEFLSAEPDTLQEFLKRTFPPGWNLNNLRNLQSFARASRDRFQKLADESGAAIIAGASAIEWRPTAIPPRVDKFNSAYLLQPGAAQPAARNDKRHLVMFGEYVPFRFSVPWIYDWLNSLTPWGKGGRHYSLSAGERNVIFEFGRAPDGDRPVRAAAPICYEEIMPYIAREFALARSENGPHKNIDLLTPISNDGWFMHSGELEQHLAAGVFRAVENRIAVARSVNTGKSAMVYPNGKIHSRVALTAEQQSALVAVQPTLEKARTLVEAVKRGAGPEVVEARRQLAGVIQNEVARAYLNLGAGFSLYSERLDRLRRNLSNRPNLKQDTAEVLVDQIDNDLATVRRWQRRPDTAPGFAVDEAMLDSRFTIYTRWGDWFAGLMLGLTGLALLDWFQLRVRRKRRQHSAMEGIAR
ncbi:MAG TPA: apolipoprotein N-acyltransferase [Phycisphaerae bacterium]|nr:apolipoprotein N-acyltransferase [Phycisphaerae bacterium]